MKMWELREHLQCAEASPAAPARVNRDSFIVITPVVETIGPQRAFLKASHTPGSIFRRLSGDSFEMLLHDEMAISEHASHA